jgi:cytochrome bd-type quinol oxidase subunit 1/mono/diheme cytochrome c family protein
MHYPWWYVPFLTSPILIALIAVIHVYVSMYAVGGGLFLAVETAHAYRSANSRYLAYLKEHTWFFILVTVVFGAITGVGIWWTIGLASPLATEALIHIFVFGWAMEYVFFVLEIVSAFIFFYFWGRLPPKTHQTIGWIYGISAWVSLVLITGITAFMLNPGTWTERQDFWVGFFNPQFLPQTIARTGGALLLASLYVYLHAAFFRADDPELRGLISIRSTRPGLLGAVLVTVGGVWWYLALPASAQAALAAASALNILMVIIFAVTIVVFAMLYLGPYRNPEWITPGFALLLFTFGLAAIGAGEFVREAVRKPFIVYQVVLSNQILPEEVERFRSVGYLESGVWTRALVAGRFPDALGGEGTIDEGALLALPESDRLEVGRVLFFNACNDCHSAADGYSSVAELMRGWTPQMIRSVVEHPERAQFFMPPFAGTPEEVDLLTGYLVSIARPYPSGLQIPGGG